MTSSPYDGWNEVAMSRWTTRLLVVMNAAVLVAGVGAAYLLSSDTATPVRVADAVGRYREEQTGTTAAPAAPRLPAPGVYVYATEGSERIDVLGGATHDYPERTTLTVAHTDCGLRQRWTGIEERWDDEELCRTEGGLERTTLHTHHEFFDMSDDQDFVCEPGYVVVPARPVPGETWTTACAAGDTRITGTGTVVGFEVLEVAGEPVETVHVRIEERASGASTGPSRDDYWQRRRDGLLVRRESSVRTQSASPVGTATYEESFALHLTSLAART